MSRNAGGEGRKTEIDYRGAERGVNEPFDDEEIRENVALIFLPAECSERFGVAIARC